MAKILMLVISYILAWRAIIFVKMLWYLSLYIKRSARNRNVLRINLGEIAELIVAAWKLFISIIGAQVATFYLGTLD